MAEDNLPKEDRINIGQGNINKEIKGDYRQEQEQNLQDQKTTNQLIFSSKNSGFSQQLVLIFLIIGLVAICYIVFSSTQNKKNNNNQQELLSNNTIDSLKKDENDINDILATEIWNNILTINERREKINSLKQENNHIKQENLNQLQYFVNNRPFCRDIYNDVIYFGLNNTWTNNERYAIGQFYIFLEKIDDFSSDLLKNNIYGKNLNSHSAKYKIDSIIQMNDHISISASIIGEIMIEKIDAQPDNSIAKRMTLQDNDNFRGNCDPRLKKQLTQIIKDKFQNPDHGKNL